MVVGFPPGERDKSGILTTKFGNVGRDFKRRSPEDGDAVRSDPAPGTCWRVVEEEDSLPRWNRPGRDRDGERPHPRRQKKKNVPFYETF